MKKMLPFLFAFCLSVLMAPVPATAREVTLTILFTGDHHGQLDPVRDPKGSDLVGGVSRRMALIEKIRQEVGPAHVVLVDCGGLIDGTPFSELSRGAADCEAYHLMGYDAVCLGENDFDYGTKSIVEYRRQFGLPWVAANVNRGGQPFMRAYILKSTGVRVGIIGFADPETPSKVGRVVTQGLTFNSPGLVAKGLHSIFKKDADIFIALTRQGLDDAKKFAKDNTFLHVVISGKGSEPSKDPIVSTNRDGSLKGPILCQPGPRGLYLGRLDLVVNGHRDLKTRTSAYDITSYHYQVIPITADLPEDPKMTALLQKYHDRLSDKPLDEALTKVTGDLTGRNQGDSLVGEIAVDALRNEAHTQIALLPNQTFRPVFKTGMLTRENLYEICPSEGEVIVLDVPGHVLRDALATSQAQKGQDGFLQVSGLTVEGQGNDMKVVVDGEPLNNKHRYLVAVNDFLAGGGAGYESFRAIHSRRKTTLTVRTLLEEALKSKPSWGQADMDVRWK
ncbi:MAG TPA: bifunctional UDP-sugar hydrolase/5'-nucleotidase [bacterium]|nr:bifunctional UDP-sugar hydrolase/5'-nucleotidase [bacterium]